MKKWIAAIALALAAVGTYALYALRQDFDPEELFSTPCATNEAIHEFKLRCGFLDLGKLVTANGTVIARHESADGDLTLDLDLDAESAHLLAYQGRRTREHLHVEFTPCERAYADVESALESVTAGDRVRVTGRWAYDGFDHRGGWREQLEACLEGREADPDIGWTEIHPAYTIQLLDE